VRLRPHPGRFPRRPSASARLGRDLVLVELSVRHRCAERTHRGDPARHDRSLCFLWLCATSGVVGQSQDGGAALIGRSQPPDPPALSSVGQSLSLRAALLSGAPATGEAACRRPGAVFAARLGHARTQGSGPGTAQRAFACLLSAGARTDSAGTNRVHRCAFWARASRRVTAAGAAL